MRLLYFSRDYTTHDHRFLTALAKTEHQVYYLRLEHSEYVFEDRPLPPEIEIVQWQGGKRRVTWKDIPRLRQDLKTVLGKVKPDIVQAGPVQRSAFLTALAGFHPLISMSWGYDLLIDAKINRWWQWATTYTLKHSDLMIGDCNTIRKLAISYGMRSDRIVTFPWGIDIQRFSPAPKEEEASQAFTLLSTRSWEPIYGVEHIAGAFVRVAQAHPELRLVMLGNGSLASLLRQKFTSGGVADRVYLPGQVSQMDLPRYFRNADLYLSASHSDGTSISLLEAMACAKPVIVSDIPGNKEWVTPGVNGWLFPDGDEDSLAKSIERAMEDKVRLQTMGQAAREITEKRANWPDNFKQMLKAYEIVQGNHR
jgi:glycosyltransferase involved in cell wall biosynthesis